MTRKHLPLGCYGKLPFWPEYLSEGVSFPTSRALCEWIHEGRHAAGMDLDSAEGAVQGETSHRRFVFGLSGSAEIVAGVLRPSADRGGVRAFPFAVFTHCPRRVLGRDFAMFPFTLTRTWEALDDAWSAFSAIQTEDAFREALREHRVPMPEGGASVRAAFQACRWEPAERIFPAAGGADPDRLQETLRLAVAWIRQGGGGGHLPVEVPVSPSLEEAGHDASFWIELINRQFIWRRIEPAVFIDSASSADQRSAYLVAGTLTPRDYVEVMLPETVANTQALRLAHGDGRPVYRSSMRAYPTFGALLDRRFG